VSLLAFSLPLGDDVTYKLKTTGKIEASLCSNHATNADTIRTVRRDSAGNAGRGFSSKMK